MANIKEWIKGILMFVLVTFIFYFWWQNIFSNILEFVSTDLFSTGATTSLSIMKTMAWISLIFIYLGGGPIYLIYTIIAGTKDDVTTEPENILIGIGIWMVSMPILMALFGIGYYLIDTMSRIVGTQTSTITSLGGTESTTTLMDAGSITLANQFSWFLLLGGVIIITLVPLYYIIKAYGVNLLGEKKDSNMGLRGVNE